MKVIDRPWRKEALALVAMPTWQWPDHEHALDVLVDWGDQYGPRHSIQSRETSPFPDTWDVLLDLDSPRNAGFLISMLQKQCVDFDACFRLDQVWIMPPKGNAMSQAMTFGRALALAILRT
jgi:hypothetical protein